MNGYDVSVRARPDWVSFGRTYVTSEGFKDLFREGMSLVEETAVYLDGEGRDQSRTTSREATLAYAGESMRLTTRLMQIASWLLVQRAVVEGEITPSQALEERRRVKLTLGEAASADALALLPDHLRALVDRSRRLHDRILHLDALVGEDRQEPRPVESPVAAQRDLLQAAFRGR